MSEQNIQVVVNSLSLDRRCRAGICFNEKATTVSVSKEQLLALQSDPYLRVQTLSADETKTPVSEKKGKDISSDDKGGEQSVAGQTELLLERLIDAGCTSDDKKMSVNDCTKLVDFKVTAEVRDVAWRMLPEKSSDDEQQSSDEAPSDEEQNVEGNE
ncbi:MAG: hypothetical protein KGV56_01300 [Gammaproteobacteria bacterium]|nr:hypothetical protein [Gammaproteobacteria bacterium]